jgi:hypothetical protein
MAGEFTAWDAQLLTFEDGKAAVIAADRFGQVFYARDAEPEHSFPTPRELQEWLKYLGTLCPE